MKKREKKEEEKDRRACMYVSVMDKVVSRAYIELRS